MKTKAHVGSREDRNADLGLQMKTPRILILLVDIVVGADLGIRCSQFQAGIGLKDRIGQPIVTRCHTKRQVKERMLLAGGESRSVTELQGLARKLAKGGLVVKKTTDGDLFY